MQGANIEKILHKISCHNALRHDFTHFIKEMFQKTKRMRMLEIQIIEIFVPGDSKIKYKLGFLISKIFYAISIF